MTSSSEVGVESSEAASVGEAKCIKAASDCKVLEALKTSSKKNVVDVTFSCNLLGKH